MQTTLMELAKMPALIDTAQAAEILNCHPNLVMSMCRSGECFQAMKIGREWRINTADLIRWAGLEEDISEIRQTILGINELSHGARYLPVITEINGKRHIRFEPIHTNEAEVLIG